MPSSKKPAPSLAKSVATKPAAEKPLKAGQSPATKTGAAASKSAAATKVDDPKKAAAPAAKKVGRPPKAAGAATTGAKRGRKPKADKDAPESDIDLSDIEDDLAGARSRLRRLEELGIDRKAICEKLLADGIESFNGAFRSLLEAIERKAGARA